MQELYIVILAAGKGTRMRSNLPKVLHQIGGKPMLARVIETAKELNPKSINVVVGHAKEKLFEQIHYPVNWVVQDEQLGTGHAVKMALSHIPENGNTLILYGDVPLINKETLIDLLETAGEEAAILTDVLENPTGYGRVIRDAKNQVMGIVEEKDADQEQKCIKEVNTGIYVFPNRYLHHWLNLLKNENAKHEFYLTDVIGLANENKIAVKAMKVYKSYWASGVNDKIQLGNLERVFQLELAYELMKDGLTLIDPKRFDLRGTLKFGLDVVVDVNVLFEGDNKIGNNVKIGANCVLRNVVIQDNVVIKPFSHLDDCEIGEAAQIGPYARLRPNAKLSAGVHIGNFVEVKASQIGKNSKVNHLTYIGDTIIGQNTNIGAGTVTCNYDGVKKYQTIIGDDCRVGSGTMLVAPVVVGHKATIGAGSVITKKCPENQLTVSRSKQVSLASWVRPEKKNQDDHH